MFFFCLFVFATRQWILASRLGIEPTVLALGDKVLTPEPPGQSWEGDSWGRKRMSAGGRRGSQEQEVGKEGPGLPAVGPRTFPWQVFDPHPTWHPLHQSWLSWTQKAPDVRPNSFLLQPSPAQCRPSVIHQAVSWPQPGPPGPHSMLAWLSWAPPFSSGLERRPGVCSVLSLIFISLIIKTFS